MRLTANQNACNASDIHVFLLAENVWETKPMVMDLNLFDSFLLTVFMSELPQYCFAAQ